MHFIILTLGLRPISFIFKEEEIVICSNDEHPEKALQPISVTEDGILI